MGGGLLLGDRTGIERGGDYRDIEERTRGHGGEQDAL